MMVQNNIEVSCPNHLIVLEMAGSQEEVSSEVMKDSKVQQAFGLAKITSADKATSENKSVPKNSHRIIRVSKYL